MEFAGFGEGFVDADQKLPPVQQALDKYFVAKYSVKFEQRCQMFLYLFQDEALDDLPAIGANRTVTSTVSAISRFDSWFCSIPTSYLDNPAKTKLLSIVEIMLRMDIIFPPFICFCELLEHDRGVILAHFSRKLKKNLVVQVLKRIQKDCVSTGFQHV